MELLYDLTILLLDMYLKELKAGIQTDALILLFMAALFTIAIRWKQLKCLLAVEWTSKMLLYIQGRLLNLKKEWNSDTYCHIDKLWKYYPIEISLTQKGKYHMILLIWGIYSRQIPRYWKYNTIYQVLGMVMHGELLFYGCRIFLEWFESSRNR